MTPLETGKGSDKSVFHCASHHSITKRLDDVDQPRWTVELEAYGLQALMTNYITGIGQVHLQGVQVLILLAALFQDCPSVSSEATKTLGEDIIQRVLCDTVQYDACYDLSCNTQHRDASVVITGCSVTFVLVQLDDVGVLELILRH